MCNADLCSSLQNPFVLSDKEYQPCVASLRDRSGSSVATASQGSVTWLENTQISLCLITSAVLWGFFLQPSVFELVRQPDFANLPLVVEDFVKDNGGSYTGGRLCTPHLPR